MQVALTIAGSDPTGGAGLQADLQVFRLFGVHGAGVVTALTVQDTAKVHQVLPVFPSVVLDQLRVFLRDIRPNAIKIGMLGTDDVALNVEIGLAELTAPTLNNSSKNSAKDSALAPRVPMVIDPVLYASSGKELLERRAWARLQDLCGQATLVTPNLPEAEFLTGCDVSSEKGVEAAAAMFVSGFGAEAALVKGGHAAGPPRDLLAVRDGASVSFHWLEGKRIGKGEVHGTGCALSSAIAAGLALGQPLREAVDAARVFVRSALERAKAAGKGASFLNY